MAVLNRSQPRTKCFGTKRIAESKSSSGPEKVTSIQHQLAFRNFRQALTASPRELTLWFLRPSVSNKNHCPAAALVLAALIALPMEMCGRIAVVRKVPVFSVVRRCLGHRGGLIALIASNLLNLITCAAELSGIAIVLRLLTGAPERLLLILAGLVLGGAVFLRVQMD
jgi:hypothetical protein